MRCIGYITDVTKEEIQVILPEMPQGNFKVTLSQGRYIFDKRVFENFDPVVLYFIIDENNKIRDWYFDGIKTLCETRQFVALLADGTILADDGQVYVLYDHKELSNNKYSSMYQYVFGEQVSPDNSLELYVKDGVIYGIGRITKSNKGLNISKAFETYVKKNG